MHSPILIYTSTDSLDSAKSIANALVKSRLAACVSINKNVESVYRWKDKICNEVEYELKIKTQTNLQKATELLINELSTYECPEFIVCDIADMSEQYEAWFKEQLK